MMDWVLIGLIFSGIAHLSVYWPLFSYMCINARNEFAYKQIMAEIRLAEAQISLEKAKRGIPEKCLFCARLIAAETIELSPASDEGEATPDRHAPNPEEPPCDSAAQS